jgi:hypothetical protein
VNNFPTLTTVKAAKIAFIKNCLYLRRSAGMVKGGFWGFRSARWNPVFFVFQIVKAPFLNRLRQKRLSMAKGQLEL